MKRIKQRTIFTIILAAVIVMPVFADRVAMPAFSVPNVAASGFGGPHIAYTDNVFSLLVNPAAMIRTQERSFLPLSVSLFNPESVFDISSAVMDIVSDGDTAAFGNMANTMSAHSGRIALGTEFQHPISFAWVANGFGFAFWNRTFVQTEIVGNMVRATVFSDMMLPVGFAFRVLDLGGHSIDAGLTLKPFIRVMAQESLFIMDLMDNEEFDFTVPVIAGGGLDFGLLYRWDVGFQAGITFTDILSRGTVVSNIGDNEDNNTYYVPFAVNLGVAYSFRPIDFLGITLAANWRDIGNAFNQTDYLNNRNFLLDFGFGAQFSLFNMFYVRMGMNEMLPAVGLGVSLGAIRIDFAYYGREFGYEPGMLPAASIDLSIAIRPGARQRDWVWTRGSVFGLLGVGN